MLRKEKENQNQNHQKKEIVGQTKNRISKSSKNTLRNQTNAHVGGILKEQTVLVAKKGKIFSSVATLCTTTAIKRKLIRRA